MNSALWNCRNWKNGYIEETIKTDLKINYDKETPI